MTQTSNKRNHKNKMLDNKQKHRYKRRRKSFLPKGIKDEGHKLDLRVDTKWSWLFLPLIQPKPLYPEEEDCTNLRGIDAD